MMKRGFAPPPSGPETEGRQLWKTLASLAWYLSPGPVPPEFRARLGLSFWPMMGLYMAIFLTTALLGVLLINVSESFWNAHGVVLFGPSRNVTGVLVLVAYSVLSFACVTGAIAYLIAAFRQSKT
jgi:hypothetical protein